MILARQLQHPPPVGDALERAVEARGGSDELLLQRAGGGAKGRDAPLLVRPAGEGHDVDQHRPRQGVGPARVAGTHLHLQRVARMHARRTSVVAVVADAVWFKGHYFGVVKEDLGLYISSVNRH